MKNWYMNSVSQLNSNTHTHNYAHLHTRWPFASMPDCPRVRFYSFDFVLSSGNILCISWSDGKCVNTPLETRCTSYFEHKNFLLFNSFKTKFSATFSSSRNISSSVRSNSDNNGLAVVSQLHDYPVHTGLLACILRSPWWQLLLSSSSSTTASPSSSILLPPMLMFLSLLFLSKQEYVMLEASDFFLL